MRSLRDLCATPTRSVRDLRDLLAICSRSVRDLHATCAIWARSGRDLGAICVRSCLEPWCARLSAGRRISPNVAEVVDCSRLLPSAKSLSPTKVTQQSYQKVCFEHFGSGLECRPAWRGTSRLQLAPACSRCSPGTGSWRAEAQDVGAKAKGGLLALWALWASWASRGTRASWASRASRASRSSRASRAL